MVATHIMNTFPQFFITVILNISETKHFYVRFKALKFSNNIHTTRAHSVYLVVHNTYSYTVVHLFLICLCCNYVCFRFLVYKRRHQYYSSDKRKLCPKLCGGYMELKDLTFD